MMGVDWQLGAHALNRIGKETGMMIQSGYDFLIPDPKSLIPCHYPYPQRSFSVIINKVQPE